MVAPSKLIILWQTMSGETAGRNVTDVRFGSKADMAV